jgi:hypothetical protein
MGSAHQAAFAAATLRKLVWSAGSEAYGDYIDIVEPSVWEILQSAGDDRDRSTSVSQAIEGLPGARKSLELAAGLLLLLSAVNPICAVVPVKVVHNAQWPYTHRFTIERRVIPERSWIPENPGLVATSRSFLQSLLDVRTFEYGYVASASLRTASYHLEFDGPEGTYLAGDETDPWVDHARLTARRGQRRSHLYLSNNNTNLTLLTKFFERGPGSFASTTVASIATAVIIAILAVHQETLLHDPKLPQQPWLVPALLAVPLAVTTLTGLEISRFQRHPSLLSRVLNLAIIAVVLLAFSASSLPVGPAFWWSGFNTPYGWHTITFASVLIAVVSSTSWVMRLALEVHFIRGKKTKKSTAGE